MKYGAVLAVFAFALSASAAAAETERFVGTGGIEGQPEFPVHAEIVRSGNRVTGTISIPGSVYKLEGGASLSGRISGTIKGDGADGQLELLTTGQTASGTFVLGGAPGKLALTRTEKSSEEALGPPDQTTELTTQQWRDDLKSLVIILREKHGAPFHRVTEQEFQREAARIDALLPSIKGPRVAVEFRRLASLIGDGHTAVSLFRDQPRYPFRFWWFKDGLRVVETDEAHRDLLGAKLTAIDGAGIRTLLQGLRPYSAQGENEAYFKSVVPLLINRPEVLESLNLSAPKVRWHFRTIAGGRVSVRPVPANLKAGEWILLGGQGPLWARNPEKALTSEYWKESHTLYVNFRRYDGLQANVSAVLRELDAKRPNRLVLDLRDNGGGDFEKGRALLISEIIARPWINKRGRLFVLIGRDTFSAAMVNAADFKASTNATLVGESIGEKPNSWQESRRFYLPGSGLPVNVSTKYYSFASKGTDSIEPDISAPPDWRDWMKGADSAVRTLLSGK